MSEQIDSLELLLKIRSQGAENLQAVNDLVGKLGKTVDSNASTLDNFTKRLNQQTEAVRKFAVETSAAVADIAKRQVEGAARAAEDASNRETAAIERTIKALERKAALAGKSGSDRLDVQKQFALDDLGKTESAVNRITAAYDKLSSAQASQSNFASQIRSWITNPLYEAGKAAESLITTLGPIGQVIGGIAVAGVAASIGIVKLANSMAETAREITNFSLRTGLSVQATQEFIGASKIAGVNAFAFESSVRKLSEALAEGGLEGKKSADALARLGITAYNIDGQLRPMDSLVRQIFENLNKVSNPADRMVLALQLLGRSGRELIPLLGNYDAFAKKVQESGVIIGSEGIDKADKYRQSVAQLGLAWDGLVQKLQEKAVGVVSLVMSGAFGVGDLSDTLKQKDLFDQLRSGNPSANGGFETKGGLRGLNGQFVSPDQLTQARIARNFQDLQAPGSAFGGFGGVNLDTSNIFGLDSPQARARNARQRQSLLEQYDPGAALRQAQDALKATVDKLGSGDANLPAGISGELSRNSSNVKRLQALEAAPKVREEEQQRFDQTQAKELFGEQQINAEIKKRIDYLKSINQDSAQNLATEEKIRQAEISRYNATLQAEVAKQNASFAQLTAGGNASQARLRGSRQSAIDIATGRLTPDSAVGINAAFGDRVSAANQSFQDSAGGVNALRQSLAGTKDPIEQEKLRGQIRQEQFKAALKYSEDYYNAESERIVALINLDKKRADEKEAADRKIAAIEVSLQVGLINQQSQRAGLFASVASGGKGNEAQAALTALRERLNLTLQLTGVELNRINAQETGDQRRVAAAEALKTLALQTGDAQLQYEQQIAELQKKRQQENEQEAHKLAGALLTRGGTQSFIRDQTKGFETQVLGNVLTPLTGQIGNFSSGLIGGQGPGSFLGSALKGTFLSPHDEKNIPLDSNTKATTDNTAATAVLAKVLADVAAGRTPTLPGTITTGAGGAAASSVSSTSAAANSPQLQKLLSPLLFGALGASVGDSLANQFEPPTITRISDPSTFKPARFNHPLATIAGGASGVLAGLGLDFTHGGTGTHAAGSLTSGTAALVPIAQQQLDVLQQLYAAVQGGIAGSTGLPVNIQGVGGLQFSTSTSSSALDPAGIGIPGLIAPGAAPGSGSYGLAGLPVSISGIAGQALGSSAVAGGVADLFAGSSPDSSAGIDSLNNLPLGSNGSTFSSLDLAAGAGSTSSIGSQLNQFTKALGIVPGGGGAPAFWDAISGADGTQTSPGVGQAFTGLSRAGAIAGGVATLAGGAITAYQDFSRGGAKSALGGTSSILGTAAALDPDPISKGALGLAALGTSLVGALLGDPKQNYANSVALQLQREQYLGPQTINRTVDQNGFNVSYNDLGHPVSSTSTGSNVIQPYQTYTPGIGYSIIPGSAQPNFSSPAAQTPSQAYGPSLNTPGSGGNSVTLNVNALDSKSFLDNSGLISQAVYNELAKGGQLSQRIQSSILGS